MKAGAGNNFERNLRWVEWGVAILVTLAAIHLHWSFLDHAGGLWRDEVSLLNIAGLPTLADTARTLPHDHCPILFPALLRAWSKLGDGTSDTYLRCLGFGIGVGLLGMIWAAGLTFGKRAPLVSLALLATNFWIVRYADSLRAYGLAALCIVLCMVFVWRFVSTGRTVDACLAAFTAVISVQAAYQNAFLVLALCLAGMLVCAQFKQRRKLFITLSIGSIAALSLVPYIGPIQRAQDWWILNKTALQPSVLWQNASTLTGFPFSGATWIWLALIVVVLWRGLRQIRSRNASLALSAKDYLPLFSATALLLGIVGFTFFVMASRLPTQPWYYLLPAVFVAACFDASLSNANRAPRIALLVLTVLLTLAAYPRALAIVTCRQTNADLVAAQLTTAASESDLIVVHPWHLGISFGEYYHGKTPWTTLPSLEEHRFHSYDELKLKMQMPDPLRPVLDQTAATLAAGGRVWIVGWLDLPTPGQQPPPGLPPAPQSPTGWFDEPYREAWGRQFAHFIANNATEAERIAVPSGGCIQPYENIRVMVVVDSRRVKQIAKP